MRSVNKVIIIGNLTREPELKETTGGQAVVTFGVATNRDWTTREGERKNSAEFHECVAWAKLAEICKNHLQKGSLVYIEGYIKTRSWDTPEGSRRFKTEIVVEELTILDKKKHLDGDSPETETSTEASAENNNNNAPERFSAPENPIDIDRDLGL